MKPYTFKRSAIVCRLFLLFCVALARPAASLSQTNPHYNVLFIAVDDMNEKTSVFGYPSVLTPNLKRLAQRGVAFKKAYCQFPLCNPSRTSLLSGLRPDKTDVFDNNTRPRSVLGADVKFLPEYFRSHGYHTERIGKIMHGAFEDDITWDYTDSTVSGDIANNRIITNVSSGVAPGSWWVTTLADDSTVNGKYADKMIQRMKLQPPQPFFLALGFTVHNPFTPSLKYWNMYGVASVQQTLPVNKKGDTTGLKGNGSGNIKLPVTPSGDRNDVPPIAFPVQVIKTTTEWQNTVHAYYAEVTEMDAQLGFVLDEMDRQNLWQNTVVVFWSDHGQHLGEHEGTWLKNTLFEESALVPLIVCVPGKIPSATNALVELVDIYPSLAEICGLPAPEGMEGSSFARLLDNPKAPWKRAIFTQVKRNDTINGLAVSTKRYRYNSWSIYGEELYDHDSDRFEFTNLATDSAYTSVLKRMRKILAEGWTKSLPPPVTISAITAQHNGSLLRNKAIKNNTCFIVYPNPSPDGNVFIQFKSDDAAAAEITVYDNAGKAFFKKPVKLCRGNNMLHLQLNHLSAGIYNVELCSDKIKQQAKIFIKS